MIPALLGASLAMGRLAWAGGPPALGPLSTSRHLFEQGRFAEAAAILSSETMQRLRGKDLAAATLTLSKSYERLNKLDKALSVYQLGIKLFPKDINLLTGLAQLFDNTQLPERAQPIYSRILELDKHNISAHLGLASINHVLGFLDRSADHYEIILEQSPLDADLWRDYAKVLFELRDFKTAELAVGRALSIQPASVESFLTQALIWREQGRLAEALNSLKSLLASGPRQPNIASAYALWLVEAGSNEEAADQARLAVNDPETRIIGHWVQAQVYLKIGQAAAAAGQLRIILASCAPESFEAKASSIFLRQLSTD